MAVSQKQRRNYREQADNWFGEWIKNRDGRTCRAVDARKDTCQGAYRLQNAHIHSRAYFALRTDARNAVALCSSCHMYFTPRYIEWEDWVDGEFGKGYYQTLKVEARSRIGERQDWKAEAAYWKEAVANQ